MMGKIVSGHSFKGVVNYILDKNKDAKLVYAEGVRYNSREAIIESFLIQGRFNPNLKKNVGHISLSFSAEDKPKLSDEFMVKVAKEYLLKMGIKDTQFIIARHFDKEHPHIHIAYNRTNCEGKTISDKNERIRNVKICKELTLNHGLYFAKGKEQVKRERLKEPDKSKYEIYHTLKDLIPKCKDWKQLEVELGKRNINIAFKHKGQSEEIQGVTFHKNGYAHNGSKVDRQFSYSKIDHQLRLNSCQLKTSHPPQQTSNQDNVLESSLDGLAALAAFEQHGEDFDEISFANRMEYEEQQRQKKKRRGFKL